MISYYDIDNKMEAAKNKIDPNHKRMFIQTIQWAYEEEDKDPEYTAWIQEIANIVEREKALANIVEREKALANTRSNDK
jgi:hypothetical protein